MATLHLQPITKPDNNKLSEAYEVVTDLSRKVGGATIFVPKFFQYDGSSIPSALWPLMGSPFHPSFMLAAVFHDWIYHTHQIPREDADNLVHKMLIEDGVSRAKAWLMYNTIDLVGESYWTNDPDDDGYIKRLTKRIKDDGRDPAKYGLKP
jgi:hypothetical protein